MAKVPVVQHDSLTDVWRQIPPEEKLELMARAQAKGTSASLVLIVISGTLAVGLKIPWIFWFAFLGVPFVFQFSSAKAWRDVKPRSILEFLAARSAARRYAFSTSCKDLTISMMFKGTLHAKYDSEQEQEELEARVSNTLENEVWVALFPDTVIMISERRGGAKLQFAHAIDDKLHINAVGYDTPGVQERAVELSYIGREGITFKFNLTSKYPAALLVFEKKVKGFHLAIVEQAERDAKAYREMFAKTTTPNSGLPQLDFT